MLKKIALTIAAVMAVTALQVSAERNPYNEMDYFNTSNATIQDYADLAGTSVEEFKAVYGLPEDMPGDTNEEIAYGYMPLKKLAETSGVTLDELIAECKKDYIGTAEITGDTLQKDIEKEVKLGSVFGDENFEVAKQMFGFGDEITKDTPYKDVALKVEREMLRQTGILSYDDGESILVVVKGHYIDFDVAPVIENDRVLVPMRNIFAALGAEVAWQGDVNTVLAVKDNNVVALQPGQNFLFKNQNKIEIPTAAIAKDNRILVPIRAVAEAFDTEVYYNANTKTVVIH